MLASSDGSHTSEEEHKNQETSLSLEGEALPQSNNITDLADKSPPDRAESSLTRGHSSDQLSTSSYPPVVEENTSSHDNIVPSSASGPTQGSNQPQTCTSNCLIPS